MRFTKLQGCGNDYVALDGRGMALGDEGRGQLAKRICDRHYGIGADGLLILKTGQLATFEMEMYNPDGTRGESCGNGLRCVGKFLYDNGWTTQKRFEVETMGSVKRLEMLETGRWISGKGAETVWRVDMGSARPFPDDIPVTVGDGPVMVGDLPVKVHPVSVGNPHAVFFPQEVEPMEWPVAKLGPLIETAKCFPQGANVEFVKVMDRKRIVMRTWERGAGETLSCGTGACAAAAVCMQKDLTDEEITVTLLGGDLLVSKEKPDGHLFLTGPAVTVFEGEIP